MGGEGGTANSRTREGNDIKALMKARNDHVRILRQNATRSGRAAPGPAPETLATRALPAEQQVTRWMSMGLAEPQAHYMAEPYVGMGSHYYPRGAKLPAKIGPVPLPKSLARKPMPLPKALSDSPFNVLKPRGISRGDMYEKHVAVDSHYRGGRFPAHVGGTWSRTKLGLKTHGAVGRVVHGAPPALKRTVSGAAGGAGGAVAAGRQEKRQ